MLTGKQFPTHLKSLQPS